ncbi:HIT family protein [Nocardia sp. NPDC060249]|uniref:HIT family protein n=1 Tax=Nocardia sp. NPDC060249 TaxID=3347082 RepID=UPI003650A51F
MADPCPFCEILEHGAPATIVAEWREAIAITPLNPVTDAHILVIPRKHVDDATVDPILTGIVMKYAAEVADAVSPANIITSIGAEATQTVFHLHVHVVPRRHGDGLHLPWTGQKVVST